MEITQGVKETATSSARRVRICKAFGMVKYYHEALKGLLGLSGWATASMHNEKIVKRC